MFFYRYVFIFVFTIVYSIKINSFAVELKTNNFISNQKTTFEARSQNAFTEKHIVLAEPSEVENIEETDKSLYLAGIALTSITFLFIVFILFKPEKQHDTEETKTALVEQEAIVPIENKAKPLAQKNNIVIIPDKNIDEVKSDNRLHIANEKTPEPIFSMIGMEQDEDLTYQPISEQEIIEIREAELIRPETTIAKISPESANSSEPEVNCDLMGKLTIVKSQTTKIDIVFELIQDLQKNSSANNKRAKDIRRKAIWELGQTNDFRAVEHLIQIMPEVESLEKSLILDSITQIANHSIKTINNVLLTSLEDESIEVRKNAIKDLIYLYQSLSSAVIRISQMTENSNMEVRNTAKWALEQFDKISFPVVSIDEK